jgi:DNA polymerase-1
VITLVVAAAATTGDGGAAGGTIRPVDRTGSPAGPPEPVADLAVAIAEADRAGPVRWVWADTAETYPELLRAGVRVRRCHDLALAEAVLLAHAGRWGEPRLLPAAHARLVGGSVSSDPEPVSPAHQPALFESRRGALPPGTDPLGAAIEVYADQLSRVGAAPRPGQLGLLLAIDSAGALAAVEMSRTGLPWRPDVHSAQLTDLLGPRPAGSGRPQRLAVLAAEVAEAFGAPVNPDSPADVLRAFTRAGLSVPSTRSQVLRRIEHPAVAPLLAYKELARLYVAHGWSWQQDWVRGGRFRPEFVPAGVVSGRWATRGGGGLQIPRQLRRAVVADPGWVLVVADAGQLEPRVLAAMSGDPAMVRAAGDDDLYAALAAEAFGGDRARAKVGLLGAMYGQTGGQAAAPLATLRWRYPVALRLLEEAAGAGESGALVRSHLGRTCPPARPGEVADPPAARARGRFTRNFVVQASAAEWAGAMLAVLRTRLAAGVPGELVFFQHDEVVVHCPSAAAAEVEAAVVGAGEEASRLLFGTVGVRFPLTVRVAECYADAH